MDYYFRKTRPQDDIITTRVGVDDSFDSCETICVDVLCVKAIAILVRSMSQPRLIKQNDGEHSTVEVVRQTCDELQIKMQPVTPTDSKGSNGRLEQATKATEGMTRTVMSSLETRYEVEVPNCQPGLSGHYRQHQRDNQSAILQGTENLLWRDPGPHRWNLRSKCSYGVEYPNEWLNDLESLVCKLDFQLCTCDELENREVLLTS